MIPFFASRASPFTAWDWNYTTLPMKELNNRSIIYPRGHILGGSSSVSESFFESNNDHDHHNLILSDYMIYNRGSYQDWDRYASISGDEGWSWDSVQQYFRKACHLNYMILLKLTVIGNRMKSGLNLLIIIILPANSILQFTVPLESTESASLASLKLLLTQGSFKPPKAIQMSSHSTWI